MPHKPISFASNMGPHLPWEPWVIHSVSWQNLWRGEDEVQGRFLSLQVVTTNKATATARESPNFAHFNSIEQGSSVREGREGIPCSHCISHISHPELPSTDRGPDSQGMMKISFTAQLPEFIYPRSVELSCLPIFPEHSGLPCAGRFRS